MGRINVHEFRGKSKEELRAELKALKAELCLLREAKATGGDPDKLSKNIEVRTTIATVLKGISQKQKAALREAYRLRPLVPLDLRPKTQEDPCHSPPPHQAPGQEQWEAMEKEEEFPCMETLSLKTEGKEA